MLWCPHSWCPEEPIEREYKTRGASLSAALTLVVGVGLGSPMATYACSLSPCRAADNGHSELGRGVKRVWAPCQTVATAALGYGLAQRRKRS